MDKNLGSVRCPDSRQQSLSDEKHIKKWFCLLTVDSWNERLEKVESQPLTETRVCQAVLKDISFQGLYFYFQAQLKDLCMIYLYTGYAAPQFSLILAPSQEAHSVLIGLLVHKRSTVVGFHLFFLFFTQKATSQIHVHVWACIWSEICEWTMWI